MILQKLIVLILIAQTTAVHCPVGCICTQGTVNCVQRELSTIPIIPSDALIVDLRYNKIEAIESKCFESLLSLHTIFLNDNRIGLIENNAFLTLPEVRYLFLNNNRISQISPDAFIGLQELQSLHLQNNDIWELNSNPFHSLQQLRELFLFNNKITKIPEQTFSNLPQLMRLNLDNNPIECDCGVHSILKKFKGTQKDTEIFLTCSSPPNLFGKSFNILDESDFHCKTPRITQESHDVEALIGENVEITCEADGDPQPYISWIQNSNEVIPQNPRLHVLPNGSLNIVDVKEEDEGVYECKARNLVGETKSRPVRMAVKRNYHGQLERPKFSVSPRNLYVLKNEPINLDCTATGTPTPEISWYFNERHLAQSTDQIRIFSNGTLVIPFATKRYEGIYTCKASSSTDTIESSAHVQVGELPEIILAPQNQIMKVGETLVLECDAEGSPPPKIEWKHNNTTLASSPAATNRITIQNENTEVLIQFIKESDSGHYTCIAENINGKVEATATIIIENNRRPPHLIFEPYNTEAVSGTTIELPCKGDGNPPPQVKWRKDGRLIAPFPDKYEISKSGSLFIINFTEVDNGRYECSLYNEYGRATAQGLVTLRNNEVLPLGDRFVKVAFVEASREIDLAINNTVKSLFAPHPQNTSFNHGNLFHIFRFPTGEARQIARAAEIYERTLVNIRKHIKSGANLTMISKEYEYKELLSQEHLHLVAELSGCMTHRRVPNCTDMCFHSKYRTIDGTCNNLNNPTWGASLTAFRRLSQPSYENGFSMPIGWTKGKLYHGFPKPSARFISTELISTKEITSDNRITHMVMQWGQFLDHDLDHAIPSVSSESWDGIDCKKTCEYAPPCYPIEVPPNDPRIRNRRCIDLVRSSAICGSGMTSVFFDSVQPREQINQLTSYIDASQVYGYSDHFAQELRNLTSDIGVLRTGVAFPNQKDMLPFSAPQDGIDCRRNTVESNINCFVAGDIRANEQVGLLAMHVIFMREHNRIAIKLKEINPHWTGDNLYEEARKIVGAQMQHITYKQWMPLILGPQGMDMLSEYRGYNPNINPTISNEFATAAMRFGHSLINPILHRLNENFQPIPQGHLHLHNAFFAPWRLVYEGGVDPLLRGMFHTPAKLKLPNQNLNAELTEKLFFTAHAVALDLAAINIQRGREHGIPAYNEYRKICNMSFAKTFDDLKHEISSEEIRKKLKNIYGHPSNIDLWVGGILEDQVEGGKVGPLFRCLLVEQFKKLRDGDRFYYENPSVFTTEQLQEIKKSSFSRILCDNGDNITKVTQNVFLLPNAKEDYRECWSIPGVNLYFWQDCGTCNSIPPLLNTYVPEIYHRPKRAAHFSEQNNKTYEINNLLSMNEQRVSGLEEIISTFQNEIIEMKKKLRNLEETCNNENSKYHQHHCKDSLGTKRLYNETWFEAECTKCQCKSSGVLCKTEHCAQIACPADSKPFKVPGSCCTHCSKI